MTMASFCQDLSVQPVEKIGAVCHHLSDCCACKMQQKSSTTTDGTAPIFLDKVKPTSILFMQVHTRSYEIEA